jgi:hypothetical protein
MDVGLRARRWMARMTYDPDLPAFRPSPPDRCVRWWSTRAFVQIDVRMCLPAH